MSNLTVQAQINSANTYSIPVVWKQVVKILNVMEQMGVKWDGTANSLDAFFSLHKTESDELNLAWWALTPKKITNRNRDSLSYIPYVAS